MIVHRWDSNTSNERCALVDRSAPSAAKPHEPRRRQLDLIFGRREVSVARREVRLDGVLRPLQPRPFDLLVYLIENRDRVVTTDELLDNIWRDEIVQPGSLAAAVMRIRKALLDTDRRHGCVIRTHQGIGYRFVGELDDRPTTLASSRLD